MHRLPTRRIMIALLGLFGIIATACTITAPRVKVEVASTPGAPEESQAEAPSEATVPGDSAAAAVGDTSVRRQISAPSAAAAAAASRGCKPQAVNENGVTNTELKLGTTFARSGPVANISGPIEQGVRAYFREVNEAGGICGRRISLVAYDDGWNPQEGSRLIRKLVEDDKVFFLAVVPSSLGLKAATQYLDEKKIPVVGTSGLLEEQFRSAYQWAAGASTGLSSPHVGIPFLVKERGIKTFGVFYVNDLEVGRLAAATIEDEIKRHESLGAKLCAPMEGYGLTAADYAPGWARMYNESARPGPDKCGGVPDFVFFALDPSGIIRAAKQAPSPPRKGWGGGPPAFLDLIAEQVGPPLSSGGIVYMAQSPYTPPIAPFLNQQGVQAYVRSVQKYYGTGIDLKNPYLEGGYCGAAMVTEAIRLAGAAPTRAKIVDALDNLTNWSCGVSLPMTFSKGNHFGNKSFVGVRLEFSGNAWTWKPETCTTPSLDCWRTDPRVGELPPKDLMDKYKAGQ